MVVSAVAYLISMLFVTVVVMYMVVVVAVVVVVVVVCFLAVRAVATLTSSFVVTVDMLYSK